MFIDQENEEEDEEIVNGRMTIDGKQSQSGENGSQNMVIHAGTEGIQFKCEECGYQFKDSKQLDLHRIVHLTASKNIQAPHMPHGIALLNSMQNNEVLANKVNHVVFVRSKLFPDIQTGYWRCH